MTAYHLAYLQRPIAKLPGENTTAIGDSWAAFIALRGNLDGLDLPYNLKQDMKKLEKYREGRKSTGVLSPKRHLENSEMGRAYLNRLKYLDQLIGKLEHQGSH